MKGLILAGGVGTRLRPFTYSGAKQLVPVANRPVLYYVVDNLVDAQITDLAVVISPETGREVKQSLGDGSAFGARLTYVLQDKPLGIAHAVKVARPFLQEDDFVMFLGDNLIGTRIAPTVQRFARSPELSAFVLLKEVSDPSAFGVVKVDAQGNVMYLQEKPKHPPSNLALVGVYLFRRVIHDAIDELSPSWRGELEITDAITRLMQRGGKVSVETLSSWWLDTGKKDDLLLANDTVLDDWLKAGQEGQVDEDSKITGRVRVEKGAKVIRSTIRGPAIIGRDAELIDARIGPFTSIGDRVKVHRSTVDHSVLMEECLVQDIPRLEDSLIGRRVIVRPGASRHGALSLMVGDDCLVELSRERGG
ncbi:MAG TPA: glucose-1-phosphate thymidylyltransferase [Polyangiaceae bacterium]|nr:MAG: Glucose-1-phosphate thymidylyltransferase [Deltaproteobacteria bacterium ADurb.Bin207]HNZ24878.1 glucose-1-phosphate thymidylyltransferase [Polyangiaceae bacterium]HOD24590.1 glucose-1-phosphate thymidylyltransferase [Polyangiaceae bacterium]HOE50221.1 glucose-1-phosphate thymidylyltransferase [Polyangiaceae bacterium]HOH02984.1 glucose-1-phosphate thymidylyltransferase [Polyangiaceae bacterium]